jgi:uncharacterized protein
VNGGIMPTTVPGTGSAAIAAAPTMASAIYEGVVRHTRFAPHPHEFEYRMTQLYLDLDDIERVFAGRWLWSTERGNIAQFRRTDYLGPAELSLADAVRRRVELATGQRPMGPIRMLTHLRYFGHVFNPVSFYYCFAADGVSLACIVAEITNMPWGERHAYVLPIAAAQADSHVLGWSFPKAFHVSPFLPMACDYAWRFTAPAADLGVHMDVMQNGRRQFAATLTLRRRPLNSATLSRVLWRYPLMTARVVGAIHWQAFRLWLKRNPIYDHPQPH